ncbi:MAG: hypothetical protein JOY62_03465 [Acidobacteriaceae bacterium]|nr:hypothetical protein [Acidobacteriaceae bacterium]MBV9779010.1 hypothetical protein [Acidobacteriaceae bacterium]
MTSRQIRRAAERQQRKQARKAANGFVFSTAIEDLAPNSVGAAASPGPLEHAGTELRDESDIPALRISPAQFAANRANSQLSTGPRTEQGKARSSLNAVKNGLTGRTVLLPSDDAALYQQHVQDFANEFHPVGRREIELVQALADHAWRLMRIPALEMAIYASGYEQFAPQFADRAPDLQNSLIQMHTYLHYEKQLRNLQLQESRLRRHREKDLAELRHLQQQRLDTTAPAGQIVPVSTKHASPAPPSAESCPNLPHGGFEFSLDDVDAQLNAIEGLITARHTELEAIPNSSDAAIPAMR